MERYRSEKIILQAGLLEILNKKNINLHLEKLEFERLAGKNTAKKYEWALHQYHKLQRTICVN
jgi:hypothetical protein